MGVMLLPPTVTKNDGLSAHGETVCCAAACVGGWAAAREMQTLPSIFRSENTYAFVERASKNRAKTASGRTRGELGTGAKTQAER